MGPPPSGGSTSWRSCRSTHGTLPASDMRLTLDLRLEQRHEAVSDERLITLIELARMAREPRALLRLLRGERFDEVVVEMDREVPLSAVQARAVGLPGLGPARA